MEQSGTGKDIRLHARGDGCSRGWSALIRPEDRDEVLRNYARTSAGESLSFNYGFTGNAALEMFAAEDFRPELLVSDIIMPGMRGTALAKKLRALDPSLRVIFVSGFPGPLDEEFSSIKLLVKPFRPTELLRQVGEEFTRQPQSAIVDTPPPS